MGYSWDYFKPDFRSLEPLGSILQGFEGRHAGFWSNFFRPFVKNGGLLDPNFEKIILGNIFYHKEDSLGII